MEWLNKNFPDLKSVDVNNMLSFPPEVCDWIKTSWTKEGDAYTKPNHQLNQTAFHVLHTEGLDSAAKHMMKMSGMDYARMRMDYG
jgi:hypothetical protein